MSLTPAADAKTERDRRERVELCGKNRGPHDYIPIQWSTVENIKRVTRLMCRNCFCNVSMVHILNNYPDVSY
jgi:hypothetical protein